MTNSQWKRPLIGGILSAILAGLTIYTGFYFMPNIATGFFALIFITPAYLVESCISVITFPAFQLNESLGLFIAIIFWLIAGTTITKYFERNKAAIGCWLLLYLFLIPVGFGIFFLKTLT
jgi:hypothetical protein